MNLTVLLFLFHLSCIQSNLNQSVKIINGVEGKPGQYPFKAALTDYISGLLFCGGTVIHRRFVLTAAHCLEIVGSQTRINVVMGTHDINNYLSTYQKIRSKAWVCHENYTGGTVADIGVILLERDILYNDDVHEAILYNGNDIFADKGVTGCGWGYHNTSNTASTILYCMDAVTITNARCGSFYGGTVLSNFICAQGKNHSRTCTGDSGSALVFKENYKSSYIIIGVLSFGPRSCIEGPVVYNRVPTYYQWIVNKIQNLSTYF